MVNKKVKADIALHGNPISELRDITCHLCRVAGNTTYPRGMEGWVDLVDLIAPRSGVEPATFRSRVQCQDNQWCRKKQHSLLTSSVMSDFLHNCSFDTWRHWYTASANTYVLTAVQHTLRCPLHQSTNSILYQQLTLNLPTAYFQNTLMVTELCSRLVKLLLSSHSLPILIFKTNVEYTTSMTLWTCYGTL